MWQRKRLEIFSRRGFKCEKCGEETKQLHLHHNYYEKDKNAWEYPDEAYRVLCSTCHNALHNEGNVSMSITRAEKEIIEYLREIEKIDSDCVFHLNSILYEYKRFYPKSDFLANLFFISLDGSFAKVIYDVQYMASVFYQNLDRQDEIRDLITEIETLKQQLNKQN